jgi:hydroxymethylpyrimidine/phosphomethylpyrimidine kinase
MTYPKALTIAGSDSGGGAGIQADLKTFAANGVYGLSVITALTAQNTVGVQGIYDIPPEFIGQQLDSVLSDIGADAAKTGMLSQPEVITVVAEKIREYKLDKLVVDPVMVAKSKDKLLQDEAIDTLITKLIPLAYVITPNKDEAEIITGLKIETRDQVRIAAEKIISMGAASVLIKGGHLTGEKAVDYLYIDGDLHEFESPRYDNKHTHGTGCTLSAAITANLAKSLTIIESVKAAKEYISGAIKNAQPLGRGIGPVDHLWRLEK